MAKHPASNNISQSLASVLKQDLDLVSWQPVSGGDINQAWSVKSTCGLCFFIKTNQADKRDMFEAERAGLNEIKQHLSSGNPLRVPDVYTVGADGQYAWLITEYIQLRQSNVQSESELGRGLALLHQQSAPLFGFNHDNFIGESPQSNQQDASWLNFLAEQRFEVQFQLARKHGFFSLIQSESEQLIQALPQLLASHNPKPSLLHGDLWSGNKGADDKGRPVIFDPATYYGDRECDLAMTELFGGFSPEFYAAYDDVYPIEQGYQQRKVLYNLYHILNHANLFGGSYIQQSKSMMQQLISQAV